MLVLQIEVGLQIVMMGILAALVYRKMGRSHRRWPILVQDLNGFRAPSNSSPGSIKIRRGAPDGPIYCERHENSYDLGEFRETPGFYLEHPDGRIEAGHQ